MIANALDLFESNTRIFAFFPNFKPRARGDTEELVETPLFFFFFFDGVAKLCNNSFSLNSISLSLCQIVAILVSLLFCSTIIRFQNTPLIFFCGFIFGLEGCSFGGPAPRDMSSPPPNIGGGGNPGAPERPGGGGIPGIPGGGGGIPNPGIPTGGGGTPIPRLAGGTIPGGGGIPVVEGGGGTGLPFSFSSLAFFSSSSLFLASNVCRSFNFFSNSSRRVLTCFSAALRLSRDFKSFSNSLISVSDDLRNESS
mmetsp:Transcript_9856/g.14824  ORF Transcript_9856/g.14824 Transcript_9856/m.14824 type:complete len:253 (+) Transcript_9856:1327-2085(+)